MSPGQPPAVAPVSACPQPCPPLTPLSGHSLSRAQGKEQFLPCWCPARSSCPSVGSAARASSEPAAPCPRPLPLPSQPRSQPTSCPTPPPSPSLSSPKKPFSEPGAGGKRWAQHWPQSSWTWLGSSPMAWELAASPLPWGQDSHRNDPQPARIAQAPQKEEKGPLKSVQPQSLMPRAPRPL